MGEVDEAFDGLMVYVPGRSATKRRPARMQANAAFGGIPGDALLTPVPGPRRRSPGHLGPGMVLYLLAGSSGA